MARQPPKHVPIPARAASSLPETLDPALDPSSLPPPDPSLESDSGKGQGDCCTPGTPTCLRDGNWFLKLLQAETGRMEGWCQQMEQETKDNQISEEGKTEEHSGQPQTGQPQTGQPQTGQPQTGQIGRASCRERVSSPV